MTRVRVLMFRVLDLLLSRRRERRLEEEIRDHLDLLTEQYAAAGLTPDEARAAARRAFGGVDQIKEAYRDQRRLPLLDALGQDVRFAVRMMRRNRGFAVTAVLVLGLGIGVNNMLFTILNAHTLRGLPIRQSQRVLFISSLDDRAADRGLSFGDYTDIRRAARRYREIAAFRASPMIVAGDGHAAERLDGAFVTANAFDAIGVQPVLGRGFAASDDTPGAAGVAMLSRTAWATRYGSDLAVLGRTVTVNDRPVALIGILPDRSGFPGTAEIWLPLWQAPGLGAQRRDERTLQVFGRIADDVRVEDAIAEVTGLAERLATEHPDTNRHTRARVVPINERFLGRPTDTVWLAFMTVGFIVVLISCANVANLMLNQSLLRMRELAIRASVGGSRLRLLRQLLVEGTAIAVSGAGVGLLVAIGGIRLFRRAIPSDALPYWFDYSIDWRVLTALIGVSALTVLLFALLPAIQASRTDIVAVLKDGGRSSSFGRRRLWPSVFLAAQIALAVVLLAHFAVDLRVTPPGLPSDSIFDRTDIVTAALALPTAKYPSTMERSAFYDALLDRLRASPSITAAAIASTVPSSGGDARVVTIEGKRGADDTAGRTVMAISVTPDYFRVLGLSLLQGRELDATDGRPGQENVVVNEAFVRDHFPAGSAIGRRIALAAPEESKKAALHWVTIVGIAPEIRQSRRPVPDAIVYEPFRASAPADGSVLVRGAADTATVVAGLRQSVQGLDPSMPIFRARTLSRVRDDAVWNGRLSSRLFTFLTLVAVFLSAIGLYAITAHGVSQERQEIGIRVALGARPRQIVGRVLRRLILRVAVGFGAGVLCTALWDWMFPTGAATVRSTDLLSLAIVGAILLGIVVLAAIVPSRRASRVDPLVALRVE
jgi:putative ABC transport system permease protein